MTATALTTRDENFYLNGKKLQLLSGAIHYFRVVPEYWKDLLLKAKAAGLNTVETYVPWNLHEEVKGKFNYEYMLDIRRFIQLAHEVGLYVLLRPGPYICSEWDFGGLPSWLLHDPDMKVRSMYKPYLDAVDKYFANLIPKVKDLQYSNGGPIIAVQVENEYGSYGDDLNYLTFVKQSMEKHGIKEMFFTSDNGLGIRRGSMPGVLTTVNFQEQEHGYLMFEFLKNSKQPGMPLMVMEFWSGWFDHWGEKHHIYKSKSMEKVLRWILSQNGSVNFYMFFGGTNFGFMNGANEGMGATNDSGGDPYAADVTSYDYDAPLSECGDVTEKYLAIRRALQELVPDQVKNLPEIASPRPKTAYGQVKVERQLSWEDILKNIQCIESQNVMPMEMLDINNGGGQGYGFILYHKNITAGQQLQFTGNVKDRAVVFLNGKQVDVIDCSDADHVTKLSCNDDNNVLDILVENMGRVNYAEYQSPILDDQRKGFRDTVQLDGQKLENWQIYPLEFKKDFLNKCTESSQWKTIKSVGDSCPSLYQASLTVSNTPTDTYINMEGWGKGVVFINGFNLGRYWEIGPQKTLYVPGPLLKQGDNQILIFEQHIAQPSVSFQEDPSLGEPVDHKADIPLMLWIGIQIMKFMIRVGGSWSWIFLKRIL